MAKDLLRGKVALVTGGSRNIGRGVALELAAAGADVWITARTVGTSESDIGTLRATAAEIAGAGGTASWMACDHGDEDQVGQVIGDILQRAGHIDILVNNASHDFSGMVGRRFWELPREEITACLNIGPRSNLLAMAAVVPTMLEHGGGLIVNISSHGSREYILSVPYGAGKAAIDKITHDAALELQDTAICVLSLWPGFVTGRTIDHDMDGMVNDEVVAVGDRAGESPRFVGRATVALAGDPEVKRWHGCSVTTRRLAEDYDFTEPDGSRPPRSLRALDGMDPANIPSLFKALRPFGLHQMTVCE